MDNESAWRRVRLPRVSLPYQAKTREGIGLDFGRGLARFKALAAQRINKPITAGKIARTTATVVAFVIVAVWPAMRTFGGSFTSWPDWKRALAVSWVAVVAAAYLKYSEKLLRQGLLTKHRSRELTRRKLTSARAIVELGENLNQNRTQGDEMRRVRESILQCAVLSVQERLSTSAEEGILATLVDFSAGSTAEMTVAARSTQERPVGVRYPSDRLLAWDAIRNARIAVVDDIRNDLRWQVVRERSYRAVLAVPLTKAGRAYGAISLDSETPYAFAGKTAEIAIQLQPYIALLVLTYPTDAMSLECAFDATHIWAQTGRG